jgi:hypothetical protein
MHAQANLRFLTRSVDSENQIGLLNARTSAGKVTTDFQKITALREPFLQYLVGNRA